MRKKGFTLIELLVVIAIIAMLLAILMPALNKVKKIAQRVVCGTNLKGLGTAQTVYASDYDDEYVVQGGGQTHTWAANTANFQNPSFNFGDPANAGSEMSIGASLYLLVREADVSPKSFVCPSSDQTEYEGETTIASNPDLVEIWDFGHSGIVPGTGPRNCVSYSYQLPYSATGTKSRFAADGTKSASFAVMADKNPFYDSKLIATTGTVDGNTYAGMARVMGQYYLDNAGLAKWEIEIGNSQPHDREGQNVLFADGHNSFENESDVGVKHDNIYTVWQTGGTDEALWRVGMGGVAANYGVGVTTTYTSMTMTDDSMLANDDDLSTN